MISVQVDKTWINSTLIDFQAPVLDYEECRVLCRVIKTTLVFFLLKYFPKYFQDTAGCEGWTWSSENNTAVRNNCLLYSGLGEEYFTFPDCVRKLQLSFKFNDKIK